MATTAYSHRPERRPFGRLPLASPLPLNCTEEGLAQSNSIFSVLSWTNRIQLGKKKLKPNQTVHGKNPCKKATSFCVQKQSVGWMVPAWCPPSLLPSFLSSSFFPITQGAPKEGRPWREPMTTNCSFHWSPILVPWRTRLLQSPGCSLRPFTGRVSRYL